MTRKEHLDWAKRRALEYVKAGDLTSAFASMASDLRKHPETEDHSGVMLGTMLMMGGHLGSAHQMREFIEGFN
jgi:hypothetical protein